MYRLILDTETTKLVNQYEKPDHPSQPRLVQLAALLFDEDWHERTTLAVIIKPDGWTIPDEAAKVHGITTELATAVGIPLITALSAFNFLAKAAEEHVAHNSDFDVKVITAAFHHAGKYASMHPLNPRCTKELAAPIVNLPPTEKMIRAGFGNKPKAPTLTECIKFFFDEELKGAHDALVDTRACARVYRELLRRRDVAA